MALLSVVDVVGIHFPLFASMAAVSHVTSVVAVVVTYFAMLFSVAVGSIRATLTELADW